MQLVAVTVIFVIRITSGLDVVCSRPKFETVMDTFVATAVTCAISEPAEDDTLT